MNGKLLAFDSVLVDFAKHIVFNGFQIFSLSVDSNRLSECSSETLSIIIRNKGGQRYLCGVVFNKLKKN